MRFWFDILTPKQLNFFKPVIDELRKRGHETLCTSRKYREVNELAKLKDLELNIVGEYGGGTLYGKLRASTERMLALSELVEKYRPDYLVTLSSPDACRVAFGLGIRIIGFSDSPHAEAVSRLTVPLMHKLLCPWVIPFNAFTKYGIERKKIIRYRALDPSIWIKNAKCIYTHKDLNLDATKETITFRVEESNAAYLYGTKSLSLEILKKLLNKSYNIVVLCRYPEQLKYIKENIGDNAIVMDRVIDGTSILMLSDLFIGSGGTMNCEAALLGIPNIIYNMHSIYVNKFLIREKVCYAANNPDEIARLSTKLIKYDHRRMSKRSKILLSRMEDLKKRIILELEKD